MTLNLKVQIWHRTLESWRFAENTGRFPRETAREWMGDGTQSRQEKIITFHLLRDTFGRTVLLFIHPLDIGVLESLHRGFPIFRASQWFQSLPPCMRGSDSNPETPLLLP